MPIKTDQVETLVRFLVTNEKIDTDQIDLSFVSKEQICDLHDQFFNDPSPTDCITLPIDGLTPKQGESPHLLGEIFICPEVAIEYSKESKGNPYEEVSLYIVHAFLHLIGYDDIEDADRKEMRLAEERVMSLLKEEQILLSDIA